MPSEGYDTAMWHRARVSGHGVECTYQQSAHESVDDVTRILLSRLGEVCSERWF